MNDTEKLIGKCGFYCASCPTYARGACRGCREEHSKGDCYTFDCVDTRSIDFCGQCEAFPCDALFERSKATVLDRDWLLWKKSERQDK